MTSHSALSVRFDDGVAGQSTEEVASAEVAAAEVTPAGPVPKGPVPKGLVPKELVPEGDHRGWIIQQLVARLGAERVARDLPLGPASSPAKRVDVASGVASGAASGLSGAGSLSGPSGPSGPSGSSGPSTPGIWTPTATVVQVIVASAGVRDVLERRYGPLLSELASACGRAVQWSVVEAFGPRSGLGAHAEAGGASGGTLQGDGVGGGGVARGSAHREGLQAGVQAGWGPEISLSSTVVGPSNRLAVESLLRVLRGQLPAGVPVFLHGHCGVGKTHLLRALASDWVGQRVGGQVRCMTAEQFANEFGSAVRSQRVDGFRKRVRGVDLLCIDDLQTLAGKEGMQAELVHTLDALLQRRGGDASGGAVVVAGALPPRRLSGLIEALISRLAGGLVVEVQGPDVTTATKLVVGFGARRGLVFDEPVARAVAHAAGVGTGGSAGVGGAGGAAGVAGAWRGVSVRELEGAVTKVEAVHRLLGATLSAGTVPGGAQRELGGGAGSGVREVGARVGLIAVRRAMGLDEASVVGRGRHGGARRPLTPAQVVTSICDRLGVTHAELAGRGRHHRVVLARAMSTAVARRLTSASYPEIARAIGRPNHSTVITAHQRMTELIGRDEHVEDRGQRVALAALLEELCHICQSAQVAA